MNKYRIIKAAYLTGLLHTNTNGYKYRECKYYLFREIHYFIK